MDCCTLVFDVAGDQRLCSVSCQQLFVPHHCYTVADVTMMCVFVRLMSQVADVNTQSSVGKFHFHNVFYCSEYKLLYVCLFYLLAAYSVVNSFE